jgi:hypothetical protein
MNSYFYDEVEYALAKLKDKIDLNKYEKIIFLSKRSNPIVVSANIFKIFITIPNQWTRDDFNSNHKYLIKNYPHKLETYIDKQKEIYTIKIELI